MHRNRSNLFLAFKKSIVCSASSLAIKKGESKWWSNRSLCSKQFMISQLYIADESSQRVRRSKGSLQVVSDHLSSGAVVRTSQWSIWLSGWIWLIYWRMIYFNVRCSTECLSKKLVSSCPGSCRSQCEMAYWWLLKFHQGSGQLEKFQVSLFFKLIDLQMINRSREG